MTYRSSPQLVTTASQLLAEGLSRSQLTRELSDGRWRRAGAAIVLHNGPLSREQQRRVAQIHAGPTAIFTAFTAAEIAGLTGWERRESHLLAPAGTRVRLRCPVPLRLHLHGAKRIHREPARSIEALPWALVRAAATFSSPRPGSGLLAASVQQGIVKPEALTEALEASPRTRHRGALLLAAADIGGGSQALSEIDFVRLCRRHGLPEPLRQVMRREPSGKRRYLDASWRRKDGRLVVVEVDGALHLAPRRWWDDQLRQNELALADALVLRFPTVVIRAEEAIVAAQLRRALLL